jgi:predicted CoA-binding protein
MYSRNLVDDDAGIAEIVKSAKRVAVLGAKTEAERGDAAFFVPEYLVKAGVEILPVPIGDCPEEILGRPTFRRLADVKGPVDVVDVFRPPKEVPKYVEALVALRPRCVWMQLGIRNDQAAEALARAGILVVQDRCLMAEFRKHVLGR